MLVAGLILAVVGVCVIVFLSSDIILTCQRSTDTCTLEKSTMFGSRVTMKQFPLSRLKSAEVASREGSMTNRRSRNSPSYQVVLRTDEGAIPFSNTWTSWGQKAHKQTATEINSYIASSKESLSIVQSGKPIRLFGYLFLAVGGLVFLGGLRGILRIFRVFGSLLSARG